MSDCLTAESRYQFPDPALADPQGEGLVAIGGDLSAATLLAAYRHGIFPWFAADEPICWWSPDPRCIIEPQTFIPSKSLVRSLKKYHYQLKIDSAFADVITQCAAPRTYSHDTWINSQIIESYINLHRLGIAHSIEIWDGSELIGGLYGLSLGRGFFGESMFNRRVDCSKMAFYGLMLLCAEQDCRWVDCQLPNAHLMSLGAVTIPRSQFLQSLHTEIRRPAIDWSAYQNRIFSTHIMAQNARLI